MLKSTSVNKNGKVINKGEWESQTLTTLMHLLIVCFNNSILNDFRKAEEGHLAKYPS